MDQAAIPPRPPVCLREIHWMKVTSGGKHNDDLVRIVDAEGAEGFSRLRFYYGNSPRSLADFHGLPGDLDTRNPERTWDRLAGGRVALGVLALLDLAIWDLRARAAVQPLADLLGRQRTEVPAYLSSHFNVGDDDAYLREACAARDRGFHGYKVHPRQIAGRTCDPVADAALLRKLCARFGDAFAIMHDPYSGYDREGALLVGRVADEIGLKWYESPLPEGDDMLDTYAALAAALETPVVAPEFWGYWEQPPLYETHERRIRWLEKKATDWGRIDVYCGGLTPCIRLARYCAQHQHPLDLHLCHPAQVQLLVALPATVAPYCEYFGAQGIGVNERGSVVPPQGIGAMPAPDWSDPACRIQEVQSIRLGPGAALLE